MKFYKCLSIGTVFTLASLASLSSLANEPPQSLDQSGRWNFEGSLSLVNLNADQAAQQYIDDGAISLGFKANYLKSQWITSLRGSLLMYSDDAEFSQTVEHVGGWNNGDVENQSSEASAMTFGLASGRLWRFGETQSALAVLQVGYDHVAASERSIANCSNCYSEDINIDGGAFVEGSLKKNAGSVSLGVSLTQYFTGDGLSNRIGVTIGSQF